MSKPAATFFYASFVLLLGSCGTDHNPVGGLSGGATSDSIGGAPSGHSGSDDDTGGTALGGLGGADSGGGAGTPGGAGGGLGGVPDLGGATSGGTPSGGTSTGGTSTGGTSTGGTSTGGTSTGGGAGVGGGYTCGDSTCVTGQYCLFDGSYSCNWIPSCCPAGVDCDCLLNDCNVACQGVCTGTLEEGFQIDCSGVGGAGGAGGSGPEELCTRSGGTVTTSLCCPTTEDFPNSCLTGPCGCAPDVSQETTVCSCPSGECFDGTGCVAR